MDDYLLIAITSGLQLLLPLCFAFFISISLGYFTAKFAIGGKRAARVIYLCLMFALYGVVLGFLIGVSEKSIARDAFSGVVTILSGYFGYLLSKDLHPRLKAMIPAAVICFLLSILSSMTYFSKVRTAFADSNDPRPEEPLEQAPSGE